MKFKIVIDVENDAFSIDGNGRGPELARILRVLAYELKEGAPANYAATLNDANGNGCGYAKFVGE